VKKEGFSSTPSLERLKRRVVQGDGGIQGKINSVRVMGSSQREGNLGGESNRASAFTAQLVVWVAPRFNTIRY
jgi:hypothetical protein